MSTTAVTALVQAWADGWSSGPTGIDQFVSLFTDDCHYEDVPTRTVCHGKQQLAAFLQAAFAAAPDHRLSLVHIAAAEESAGAEYVVTGTHTGDFPGLPATGKPFHFRGASILKVQGDKLHQVTDYWDFLSSGIVAPGMSET
jgi:steroid delta-isomerase-like uncharacterized protein